MRSGVFQWLTLVTMGVIVADLVTHPKGTAAALNGLNHVLSTSFSAALGGRKIG